VTNQSGVDGNGVRDIDRLVASGFKVTALFAPEHGFRGRLDVDVAPDQRQETDSATGTPVYLLHDGVRLHPPTAEMLAEVDILVVDLQDAGARYYTYPATVALIMEAAAAARLPVVVLDRPNPIGGVVQGEVQDSVTSSAVASWLAWRMRCSISAPTCTWCPWMAGAGRWPLMQPGCPSCRRA
jgi:uncharacterized protein YbbC (DUF1343 family)